METCMRSENRRKKVGLSKAPRSAWKPGQSGNHGSRPKAVAEIRDLAREHGQKAIERLVELLDSKNESVALRAAEALLARGYGRPVQGIELNSKEGHSPQTVEIVFVKPPKRTDLTVSDFPQRMLR